MERCTPAVRSAFRLALAGSLVLAASAASAQPLQMAVPPSPRPTPALPSPQAPQQLAAPDELTYIAPLSRPTRTGRKGVAVWTAPGRTVGQRGPGDPDSEGWVGGGVAVQWGGAPKRVTPN